MKKINAKSLIAALLALALLSGCGGANATGEQLLQENAAERAAEEQRQQEQEQANGNYANGNLKDTVKEQLADAKSNVKEFTERETEDVKNTYNSSKSSNSSSASNSAEDEGVPAGSYLLVSNDSGFSSEEIASATYEYIKFSKFDYLNRVGPAIGVFSRNSMKNNGRANMDDIHPTGWGQAYYDMKITGSDHEALYDRCHIIMEALSDDSTEQNLFTGTRQCNLAMLVWEKKITQFLYDNPGYKVLYKVTPDFRDDDLVCRGVTMQACSIEDNGKGLSFTVYCYNKEQGVTIDYTTGKSQLTE